MDIIIDIVIKAAVVLFLVIWGGYERLSAIRKGKKNNDSEDKDRNSLIIFYATILLGYFVGIPISFTDYGRISVLFPYISIMGFIIVGAGLSIRLAAIRTLAEHFTYTVKIISGHKLVINGIYKYIRHPSYLGQSLIFLGCGIALSNWLSLLFLFLPNFIASLYRMAIEEKALIGYFSDEYRNYMKKTKRLVPLVY